MDSLQNSKAKLIPFYYPQFHAIAENSAWWGDGFTDWVNVKKAQPQYNGHYQPRVPLNKRYYDLAQKDVIKWQVELAKSYGIYGFCHYHYWFEGKQLLETPTNNFLASKELDFPFCLCWANETWSRRWEGKDHQILQKQGHDPDPKKWQEHFDYLIKAWSDERAIKIDGKPVFLVYRPHLIESIDKMFDFWQDKAIQHGLKGIYFIAVKSYEFPVKSIIKNFDAIVQFQPFEAVYSPDFEQRGMLQKIQGLRLLPENLLELLRSLRYKVSKLKYYDYDEIWQQILKEKQLLGQTTFPGAFIDWDNTARYGARATIFKGANPTRFEYWFKQLVDKVGQKNEDQRYIFINAWNEWAEGTYLEPDEKYQYEYLEAIKRCL